jgi:hypothetical protein
MSDTTVDNYIKLINNNYDGRMKFSSGTNETVISGFITRMENLQGQI